MIKPLWLKWNPQSGDSWLTSHFGLCLRLTAKWFFHYDSANRILITYCNCVFSFFLSYVTLHWHKLLAALLVRDLLGTCKQQWGLTRHGRLSAEALIHLGMRASFTYLPLGYLNLRLLWSWSAWSFEAILRPGSMPQVCLAASEVFTVKMCHRACRKFVYNLP